MANIKISQLPSIGNSLSASTILPVVNTTGTLTTDKVAVGNIANFTLLQAGNTLPPAFVANVAYNVTNAAQPNITSVGNLTGLRITNLANFHLPGGTNGYVLQTNGSGNLSWVAQTGGGGNGTPGGSNSQLQFNLNGSFAGDPELTWDAGNNKLNTVNFAATTANISGNVNTANLNATGNVKPNAIYTDNYYYANGYAFGGGNGTPGGSNTQIQFNDAGAFAGNTGFTFNKTTGIFTSPFLAGNGNGLSNIQGANVSGFVPNANVANTAFAVAGANVSGAVTFAGTANSVAVANVVGIGNIATVSLDGSTSNVLYGNGVFAPSGSGSPAGSNTQIQFNNAGAFGSDANFSYNISTDTLLVPNIAGPANANLYVSSDNGNLTWIFGRGGALVWPGNGDHAIEPNIDEEFEIHSHNNVVISTDTANSNAHFTFDGEGKLHFNDGSAIGDVNGPNTFGIQTASNSSTVLITGDGSNTFTWNFGPNGNLTLPANTFAVNYANGSQVPLGTISSLVNGNNSLVLDGDGNIVLEGTPSGNAINRGLVWDYGANANGVNSTLRQDNDGLTVRAWTENGGGANGYSAPVSIVTNQDAATKSWLFDGQGNLNVPSGSINSINDGGDLGAYITLTPDTGVAKLAARDALSNVNYTNTSWTSGTYTGTQVDFVDAPDLVTFFNENRFNDGVNQTFSINGDEPVPFTGYSIGASNAVTVYTDVTPEPDPTTVTSINFYYQLESYVSVDYDGGELNINATGLTILIDNDQTEGPDIVLRSGDDITLQAKDMSVGSEREGGDINLNAGDGADDDGLGNTASGGGDIIIDAGLGGDGNSSSGGTGGFTQIRGGRGGTAGVTNLAGGGGYVEIAGGDGGFNNSNTALGASGGDVNIYGGDTTREGFNGASVNLTSGAGGPNAFAGSVNISTPSSDSGPGGLWQFDGAGNLTLPANTFAVNYANGVQVSIGGGSGNTGNVTFDNNIVIGTGDEFGGGGLYLAPGNGSIANSALQYLRVRGGDYPTHIHLDTGNNEYYDQYFGADSRYVKLEANGNIVINADDYAGNSGTWTFTTDGDLILAGGNSVIQSIANSSLDPVNPNVSTMVLTPDPGYSTQSLVLDPTAPGHIHLRAPGANIDEPSANIFLGGEDSSFEVGYYNGAPPNLFIHSNTNTWTFDNTGNLNLPVGGNLNFNLGGITQVINQELNIVVQDEEDDGWSIFNTITDGLGNNLSQTQLDSGSFTIGTASGGNTYSWSFEGNTLQVSSDSQIRSFGSNIALQAMSSGSGGTASLQSISNTNDPNIFTTFDATTTGANITVYDGGSNGGVGYTWQFANDGRLTFPGTPRIDTSTNNFEVQAAEAINFEANTVVNIYTDAGNTAYQWQFGDDGKTTLPTLSLGSGLDEQTVISSQRKLIPPFRWSAAISGTTPTIVYTATDVNTTSMKVTMQIQHQGLGMEFFEVFATFTGPDTYYTVGNRVAPPTIDASTVAVGLTGSNEMKITITINSGAGTSWVTYDAVEFGIPND